MVGKHLSARTVETVIDPGRYADGNGLYLIVRKGGSRQWALFFRMAGKRQEMWMGGAGKGGKTLAEARNEADGYRAQIRQGKDPRTERRVIEKAVVPTFGEFADEYVETHGPKFRNAKHLAQWRMTLGDTYCTSIRAKPIDQVDTAAILGILKPIWAKVPETAARLRGRLENVLDAAKARDLHPGPNPAAWRGHLKTLLPARQKLTRGHHAALPYDELPAFMEALRARTSTASLALELCILTASRSSEVLEAEWVEFDLEKGIWTIPASRMKAGKTHRVPLSAPALVLLKGLPSISAYVFPGNAKDKPLSNMAMSMQLRRMKQSVTVHGFRSSFRDWASEQTSFPHETCEHALAHRISDKAEAAYRRGDQFEKRRLLMAAWAKYLSQ